MKYLLDTDTCVFWLRGRTRVRERLSAIDREEIGISVITLAELRYGASCAAERKKHHQALDNLINDLAVVGVNEEVTRTFGDIKAELRERRELIEDFDLLIASTAITYGLTLVTNNTKHFERISNLSIENWV
jgi:tRNA(fMet)-specific endonuclease VapC